MKKRKNKEDNRNRTTYIIDDMGGSYCHSYDEFGRAVFTSKNGIETIYQYDKRNCLVLTKSSNNLFIRYGYDEDNNCIHKYNSNGLNIFTIYDIFDNPIYSFDSEEVSWFYGLDQCKNNKYSVLPPLKEWRMLDDLDRDFYINEKIDISKKIYYNITRKVDNKGPFIYCGEKTYSEYLKSLNYYSIWREY